MTDSSHNLANLISEHQATLLRIAERLFPGRRIPESIRKAFMDTPRHLFVPRYYSSHLGRWVELASEPLDTRLGELYADHPLAIHRDELGRTLSTISQPSLVLHMLALLQLQPGMKVFELGGGSGWNAAMLGRLVGPTGSVVSLEIIESLAATAQAAVAKLGLPQVEIQAGDGSQATITQARYDRGVFTASAWDLPSHFFQQIKTGGLLLLVLRARPGCDLLALLRKTDANAFHSETHFPCSFVPVTGKANRPADDPIDIRQLALPAAQRISWSDIAIGSKAIPDFIAFLELVKDCQRPYLCENDEYDFDEEFSGFESNSGASLILFNEDRIQLHGTEAALIDLRRAAKRWNKARSPYLENLQLSIHSTATQITPNNNQWLVPRGDCQLLWSLPNS